MNDEKGEVILEEEEEDIEKSENNQNYSHDELYLLRTEIHNKSELLKKYQNENKNLRKKYKELVDSIKNNDDKIKKRENNHNSLLKWKNTWEKVITQMTEIIPYIIPKETSSDQEREILCELTTRLCQIARNSTETAEYQNLKNKYLRNKQKLIKLKEQCTSLLDIIQAKKNQAAYEANKYCTPIYSDEDDIDIIYHNDYDTSNQAKRFKSRFYFQPAHNEIYLNNFKRERENSPTIQNLYCQNQKINQDMYNLKSQSINIKRNEYNHYPTKKKAKSKIQISNSEKNDIIYNPTNEEKVERFNNHEQTSNATISNSKEKVINEKNSELDVTKTNKIIQTPPLKIDLVFSNPVEIDLQSNSKTEKHSNESDHLLSKSQDTAKKSQSSEQKETNSTQKFQLTEYSKESTSKIEKQKNEHLSTSPLKEFNKIDQEFSENEAEEVLNELETMNSNNNNEIKNKSSEQRFATHNSEKNTIEKKKSVKKDIMSYQIRYGNNVNELIDITNRLRDQYYEVNKKYGHDEQNSEFSKENDIVKIQDPLLNQ